ncbi:MAG: hypothetical protein J6Q32_01490 [Clostridia bacterium]|nr:hypothetical protein [Clostridia bacterium]
MFLEFITVFIKTHGTALTIITFAVAIITIILDKLLKNKARVVSVILPFVLGILFNLISNLILFKKIVFSFEVFYAGFLSGTFSSIISAFIKAILARKPIKSPVELMVEEILSDAFGKENLGNASQLIACLLTSQNKVLKEEIEKIILTEINVGITDFELHSVSALILSGYKTLSF